MSEANTSIQIFSNKDFGEIRTLKIDGEPWFVGKDMADKLGYSNASKAVCAHVDEEDKRFEMLNIADSQNGNVPIGQTKTALINESGLYSLILSSKLPTAKQFKHWITSEVLPTIRKTGGYVANENNFIETYLPFADENTKSLFRLTLETVKQQNELIQKQSEKIEQDKPLVEFADHVSNTTNLLDIGELAKFAKKENINIGRTRLFEWLRDNDYLMSSTGHKNQPYQKYIEQGLFKLREYTHTTPYGEQAGLKTYVTGKGQIYFIEKLRQIFGNKQIVSNVQEV